MMTKKEFFQWLDTCPSNFDENGNRIYTDFLITEESYESTTIRFFHDEEVEED